MTDLLIRNVTLSDGRVGQDLLALAGRIAAIGPALTAPAGIPVLDALEIDNPVLFGHSDGGSIALLHAGLTTRPTAAVAVLAPHVLVEDISVTSIEAAKRTYETTDLREKLRRLRKHFFN